MTTMLPAPPRLAGAGAAEALSPSLPATAAPQPLDGEPVSPGYLLQARKALAANPHLALAHARLAQAAQAAGFADEALEAARSALQLGLDQGTGAAVHAALVVLAAFGQDAELAKLIDDRRTASLPVSLRLYAAVAAGQHTAAIGLLNDPLTAPGRSPTALALRAWLHIERDEYERSISAGRRAQMLGVRDVSLYANLGYAHAALGHLDKAIKLTRQAAAVAPLHRGVAHNLARFLTLAGRSDEALRTLERLQADDHRLDVALALSLADAMSNVDRLDDARRLLQRVRASAEWAMADSIPRAQLEANLAILRWKTDKVGFATTMDALLRALIASDYRSLSIANLLTNLTTRSEHAGLLASAIDRLHDRHDPERLRGLLTLLAVLRHEGSVALEHAKACSANQPLNPDAAARATDLIADLEGNFTEAVQIGLRGLARAPCHQGLINNTAYALALSGEPLTARRLLQRLEAPKQERVELIATRALVELMLGHTDRGLAGYHRARELAVAQGNQALADMVTLNAAFARLRVGLPDPTAELEEKLCERIAHDARSRPLTWIVCQRAKRELGIDLCESP